MIHSTVPGPLLAGRVALVTGGASAIGRAISLRFAEHGAAVVIADRQEAPREGGEPTHRMIRAGGGRADFVAADVTDGDQMARAVEVGAALGGIDILVNNAGVLRSAPFLEVTEADFDLQMAVNLRGLFFTTQVVVADMVAAGRPGTVINLSSTGGIQGVAGLSAYCATKGAVRLLTYALGKELAPRGIRVCALHPGTVDTTMTRQDIRAVRDDSDPRRLGIPMGRFGDPGEIANAAVLLASDLASYVTGCSLTVDGGQLSVG